MAGLRIGIVGDFNPAFHSHHATNTAIREAAQYLGFPLVLDWVPTPSALKDRQVLAAYDGLWLSSGSPYASMEGALASAEFARKRGRPFAAT